MVPGAYLVQAHDDAMSLNRIADELVVERDSYREKFRTMEREAELLRSQLIAMQLRAEAAEAQLAIVSGLSEWHDLPELPTHVGHYLAFWAEDGAWIAQYWPSGIEDEKGNRGHWLTTPDGSIRPNPVAWRHLPSVPDRYVVQAEYFRA